MWKVAGPLGKPGCEACAQGPHRVEEFPPARGIEVESGALLLYDEFGKVIHTIAPGHWIAAWQEDQPTLGDPSIGGAR